MAAREPVGTVDQQQCDPGDRYSEVAGFPLLQTGSATGYVLLEGIGATFAFCWGALGYGLGWSSRHNNTFVRPGDIRTLN